MTPKQVLQRLPTFSALVVGDVCLDRWSAYDPATAEASRETGIPRVGVVASESTPGAGGTVANNLAKLGVGRVSVLSAIGADGFGQELCQALADRGVSSDLSVRTPEIQTFTYTKLINSVTQVEDLPRIDFINVRPIPASVEAAILDRIESAVPSYDAVLVSDQAETDAGGVITTAVRDLLCELASKYPKKVFFADSRMRIKMFRNVIAKPNEREAAAACESLFGSLDYARLRAHLNARLLVVTKGGDGALIFDDTGQSCVPTHSVRSPVDICGAGDSFSAGMAMALAVGASPVCAAHFGNLIASVTIMKKGTGSASPAEVLASELRLVTYSG